MTAEKGELGEFFEHFNDALNGAMPKMPEGETDITLAFQSGALDLLDERDRLETLVTQGFKDVTPQDITDVTNPGKGEL